MDIEQARYFLLGFFSGAFIVLSITYFVLILPRMKFRAELLARQERHEASQKEQLERLFSDLAVHLEVCGEQVKSN